MSDARKPPAPGAGALLGTVRADEVGTEVMSTTMLHTVTGEEVLALKPITQAGKPAEFLVLSENGAAALAMLLAYKAEELGWRGRLWATLRMMGGPPLPPPTEQKPS